MRSPVTPLAAQGIRKTESGWLLETNQGQFEAKCVVNAASLFVLCIHGSRSHQQIPVHRRRHQNAFAVLTRQVKNLPMRSVITSFAGLRAHEENHEFIIGEVEGAAGFVDCAGIESPGLTASPAIGVMVAGIVREILPLEENPSFDFLAETAADNPAGPPPIITISYVFTRYFLVFYLHFVKSGLWQYHLPL